VTDLWDGATNHTGFAFNQYGWFMGKTNALGHEVLRLLRDANGRVTNRWTPEFGNTAYLRNPVGSVTNIPYPLSSNVFSRILLERITNMVDQVGTSILTWTAKGQLQ